MTKDVKLQETTKARLEELEKAEAEANVDWHGGTPKGYIRTRIQELKEDSQ